MNQIDVILKMNHFKWWLWLSKCRWINNSRL